MISCSLSTEAQPVFFFISAVTQSLKDKTLISERWREGRKRVMVYRDESGHGREVNENGSRREEEMRRRAEKRG